MALNRQNEEDVQKDQQKDQQKEQEREQEKIEKKERDTDDCDPQPDRRHG